MSAKILAMAAVLGFATASPLLSRQSCPAEGPSPPVLVNNTPGNIVFDVVREIVAGCPTDPSVTRGTVAAGQTVTLPQSQDAHGYSVKLTTDGTDPDGSNDILQFEYTFTAADNMISYDWSLVNGNPDPFTNFNRVITGDGCKTINCAAGDDTNDCGQFTTPDNGVPPNCPVTVLTATID